eukprot:756129-Hanusia_phi.AAC.1
MGTAKRPRGWRADSRSRSDTAAQTHARLCLAADWREQALRARGGGLGVRGQRSVRQSGIEAVTNTLA